MSLLAVPGVGQPVTWPAGDDLAAEDPQVRERGLSTGSPALPLDLEWDAPPTCPSRDDVIADLTRAVDPEGKELPALTARARAWQDGEVWKLALVTEMDGQRGTRQLEADSCQGLVRAVTLVLALTLGEGMARLERADAPESRAVEPAPDAAPRAPASQAFPVPDPEVAQAETKAGPSTGWRLGLGAGVGVDALGEVAPLGVMTLAFAYHPFQWGVNLEGTLPRTSAFSEGVEVRSFDLSVDLEACLVPTLGAVDLLACVQGGMTWLDAEGRGTERDEEVTVPLLSLGPRLGLRWWFASSAFLQAGAASRFFLERPDLVVEGGGNTRRIETASFSGAVGGGLRW